MAELERKTGEAACDTMRWQDTAASHRKTMGPALRQDGAARKRLRSMLAGLPFRLHPEPGAGIAVELGASESISIPQSWTLKPPSTAGV